MKTNEMTTAEVSASYRESPSLRGKIALVTGGSRGIGAAIVKRLAMKGCQVAFTYCSSQSAAQQLSAELTASGLTVKAFPVDLADTSKIAPLVSEVCNWSGHLDVIVNNAGLAISGSINSYLADKLHQMIAVNLTAPFLLIQAALPHIRRGGRIIN
ncbi:SDR family NAD(P)-dependent oxidoreductase, partial [Thioclava sp. BHET1]